MSQPPTLYQDAVDLLDEFADAGVRFLVVGAHALAAHGLPRATADFDVWVEPSPANAARVVAALRAFGAPLEAHSVSAADFEQPGAVYQLGLPPRRIDILSRISGVGFDEAWAERAEADLHGRTVPVLGRASLLTNKRATGRAKDALDVAALEKDPPAKG